MGRRILGDTDSSLLTWPMPSVLPTDIAFPPPQAWFKPSFERLIEKMLLPEVWMYWRDVSRGGSIFNAHLSSQYQEEWDPIARDNIMYSAYLQSMSLMYHYLFNDAS